MSYVRTLTSPTVFLTQVQDGNWKGGEDIEMWLSLKTPLSIITSSEMPRFSSVSFSESYLHVDVANDYTSSATATAVSSELYVGKNGTKIQTIGANVGYGGYNSSENAVTWTMPMSKNLNELGISATNFSDDYYARVHNDHLTYIDKNWCARAYVELQYETPDLYIHVIFNIIKCGGVTGAGSIYEYDQTVSLFAHPFEGYKFKDWEIDFTPSSPIDLTNPNLTFLAMDAINMPKSTRNIYANFSPITYTIQFNGNGATSGSTTPIVATYGETHTLNTNGFIRPGYKFIGWNTRANGTGTAYSENANVSNLTSEDGKTITLYAQWEQSSITNIAVNKNSKVQQIFLNSQTPIYKVYVDKTIVYEIPK